jgi:hypothetical protein
MLLYVILRLLLLPPLPITVSGRMPLHTICITYLESWTPKRMWKQIRSSLKLWPVLHTGSFFLAQTKNIKRLHLPFIFFQIPRTTIRSLPKHQLNLAQGKVQNILWIQSRNWPQGSTSVLFIICILKPSWHSLLGPGFLRELLNSRFKVTSIC